MLCFTNPASFCLTVTESTIFNYQLNFTFSYLRHYNCLLLGRAGYTVGFATRNAWQSLACCSPGLTVNSNTSGTVEAEV